MDKKQIDFINKVAPIVVRQIAQHNYQLFASVAIAQAAHESGWGTQPKMVNANALYGVKVGRSAYKFGKAWKGAAYKTGTTEYYDGKNPTRIVDFFRAYDNIEDATEDYMDMLCHCQRYKSALNRNTPAQSITAIVAGGYATGPEYATHIIDIIRQNNLTIFDGKNPASVAKIYLWQVGRTYTTQQDLYIRDNADGEKVDWLSITTNAQLNAFTDKDGYSVLRRGTRVTVKGIKEIGETIWLQIPSGWICGKNSKSIYVL